MSTTGLEVFDKTLQTTNAWLRDIMVDLGPDRHVSWHVLGAVLHTLRDRVPVGLAVHFGSQLPLLIRGLYYDQWRPSETPLKFRSQDEFLQHVTKQLTDTRPVNVEVAVRAVFRVLNHYVDPNQIANVREAMPEPIRALWPAGNRAAA